MAAPSIALINIILLKMMWLFQMMADPLAHGQIKQKNAKSDAGAAKVECTAEYWHSRKEKWPTMVPILSTMAKVFGSLEMEAYGPQLTLLDVMVMEESSGYASLLKRSSTALVNSYTREGFPYSAWRVKAVDLVLDIT
eukprot:Gb_31241 [translate_table: standard]